MKKWIVVFITVVLLTGCSSQQTEKKAVFSALVPIAKTAQHIHYIEEIPILNSATKNSNISVMVINNPIEEGKDAILAVSIENLTKHPISVHWDLITFFNSRSLTKLLPFNKIPNYFKCPNCAKPIINTAAIRNQLEKRGALKNKNIPYDKMTPTEKALDKIYQNINKDLSYVKLPNNTTLQPKKVTTGYLVVTLSKRHFKSKTFFKLNIPIAGSIHKLHYTLIPMD